MLVDGLCDVLDRPVGVKSECALAQRTCRHDSVGIILGEIVQGVPGQVFTLVEAERETAEAASAADTHLAVLHRFDELARLAEQFARLLVDTASAAEFARVVEHGGPGILDQLQFTCTD